MIEQVPEDGWPEIPVLAPYEYDELPYFETSLYDISDEKAVDELVQWYKETLVPQLACSTDGSSAPHPQHGWIQSDDCERTVVVCRVDGKLRGAWIIKLNQIYYPCATFEHISPIFRALWDETIKHFDYVWGDTENPVIMAFAQKAVRVPKSPNSPDVNDKRLEWRRPT